MQKFIVFCFLLINIGVAEAQYSVEVGVPNTYNIYRGIKWNNSSYYTRYYVEANYIPKHIGFGLRFHKGYESGLLGEAFDSYTGFVSLVGKINLVKSEKIQLQMSTGYSFMNIPKIKQNSNNFHASFKPIVNLSKHFLLTTGFGFQIGKVTNSIYSINIGRPELRVPFFFSLGLRYTLDLSKD